MLSQIQLIWSSLSTVTFKTVRRWRQDIHLDQQNRIKSPQRKQSLQKTVLGQLESPMQENEVVPLPRTVYVQTTAQNGLKI